jgi:hypothetical protein
VPTEPADKAVVNTAQPTLAVAPVTDPDGDPVTYWFRVSTGAHPGGGDTGNVLVDSNWIAQPSFSVPASALQDGVTYYWRAYARDPLNYISAGAVRSFKVDLRLGGRSASPSDQVGPVGVNLATGNVAFSTSTPALATVGGGLSQSFSYNSQASSDAGLAGEYIADTNHDFVLGEAATMKRVDTTLTFDWGSASPHPPLPADGFGVRWKGYVKVPSEPDVDPGPGTYFFGGYQNDRLKIWVNNTLVLDRWSDQAGGPNYGTGIPLTPGQVVPITVEYYDTTGVAGLYLTVKGSGAAARVAEQVVPAGWLSVSPPVLPRGWSFSAGLAPTWPTPRHASATGR